MSLGLFCQGCILPCCNHAAAFPLLLSFPSLRCLLASIFVFQSLLAALSLSSAPVSWGGGSGDSPQLLFALGAEM